MGSLSFAAKLPLSLKAVPELIRQKNVSSSSASGQEEAVDGSDGLLLRGRAVPRSARAKSVRPLLEVCVDALVVAAGGETSRSDERVLVFRPADMQDRDKWLLAINRPFHTTNTPSHTIDSISNSLHTTVSPVHAVNDTSLTPSANERGGPCEEQAGRPDAATVEVTCTAEQPTAPAVVQNHWVAAEMATAEHCVPSTVQEHQAAATIQARARKGAFPGAQIPTPQEPQCFACKEADEVCYHFATPPTASVDTNAPPATAFTPTTLATPLATPSLPATAPTTRSSTHVHPRKTFKPPRHPPGGRPHGVRR
jgi:hypothetical protein